MPVRLPLPDDRLHEPASDAAALKVRIDGDRADGRDRVALVEEIAPDQVLVGLGNHPEDLRVIQQHLHESRGSLGYRKVEREVVRAGDPAEGVEADPRAGAGVSRRRTTNVNVRFHSHPPRSRFGNLLPEAGLPG